MNTKVPAESKKNTRKIKLREGDMEIWVSCEYCGYANCRCDVLAGVEPRKRKPQPKMPLNTKNEVALAMSKFQFWDFEGSANFGDFCLYVWKKHDCGLYDELNKEDQKKALMIDYLLSVGEDPNNYDFNNPNR